jgi:hypothetical protein
MGNQISTPLYPTITIDLPHQNSIWKILDYLPKEMSDTILLNISPWFREAVFIYRVMFSAEPIKEDRAYAFRRFLVNTIDCIQQQHPPYKSNFMLPINNLPWLKDTSISVSITNSLQTLNVTKFFSMFLEDREPVKTHSQILHESLIFLKSISYQNPKI